MAPPSRSTIDSRFLREGEVVHRPVHERPTHDTIAAIADWLAGPALRSESGVRAIDEFAWRVVAAGLPLQRLSLHSGTLHPQFLGVTFVWLRDAGRTGQTFVAHEVRDTVPYANNVVRRVIEGGETIRRRVDAADVELDFPILHDLKASGATDYISLRIPGGLGSGYSVSYSTDRPDGFSVQEIAELTWLTDRLQSVCETYSQRALTRNLLKVYLGATAGPKVLAGQIRRGTGEELHAVLWSSDLRGFTERSDRMSGTKVIAMLNALFDVQAQAIHKHGGEILKFIGDGLLAIFPFDSTEQAEAAADNALNAAREALIAVRALGDDSELAGGFPLAIVVALHVGTVIYGNVGSVDRLDFTVIGPAVNLVSRVEAVAKALDEPIVVSDEFARAWGKPMRSLGSHSLRGLVVPRELFSPLA